MSIGIVNYGMGNLDSVARAVEVCGRDAVVIDAPGQLDSVAGIILPGVGAFAHAMHNLNASGLASALHAEVTNNNIPLLGICLGMQLIATRSFEGSALGTAGLGWIPGDVVRLSAEQRVPHVGWNEVHPEHNAAGDAVFAGVPAGHDLYFVHSYRLAAAAEDVRAAATPYGGGFCSAVARDHIWGVQFHPEKSQKVGFSVLQNFLELAC